MREVVLGKRRWTWQREERMRVRANEMVQLLCSIAHGTDALPMQRKNESSFLEAAVLARQWHRTPLAAAPGSSSSSSG